MASKIEVDKIDPQSGTSLEVGSSGDTVNVPSGATLDINSGATIDATGATITGFDAASDEKVKVSSDDTTPGFLNGKLTAGTSITLTEGSGGGDETLSIAYSTPATLPAASGVNLTALDAANLGSNLVPTARLGTGTASSSTVLYGDQTYKAEPGGGKILQVVTVAKSDTYSENVSGNSISSTLITGLQPSITPSATSSKILIMATITTGYESGGSTGDLHGFVLRRGSTEIGIGDADGSRSRVTTGSWLGANQQLLQMGINYIDSPSTTSSTTYALSFFNFSGASRDIYINRSDRDTDAAYTARCISTITLMEIGA